MPNIDTIRAARLAALAGRAAASIVGRHVDALVALRSRDYSDAIRSQAFPESRGTCEAYHLAYSTAWERQLVTDGTIPHLTALHVRR